MSTLTRTIAGHKLSLVAGIRYRASRPMASHRGERFDVTIAPVGTDEPAAVAPGLSYEAANRLLTAFNDGDHSWDGRAWA